jgi:DNA repair exonuclease SbcCD ATPase subunit
MIDRLREESRRAKDDLRRLQAQLATTKQTLAAVTTAGEWVNSVIEGMQQATHDRLATVVSRCLKLVFGDDAYEFAIRFESRGKVRFEFVRGGQAFDPDDQVGGGVIDVAAFALRLAAVVCLRLPRVLVLDEPFRFVSREYRPVVAELLEVVSTEFGVQIIQVTHARELVSGLVVKIGE